VATPPPNPTIYHITHVANLPSIVADDELQCDRTMVQRRGSSSGIGIGGIKRLRLQLPVTCHAGTFVGDYVPFYFCARSIMLYVIHRGNHPELVYRGGSEPVIHLQADLGAVVAWAQKNGRKWAFSLSNAGARYAAFRSSLSDIGDIDWNAVTATDFRSEEVKEGKQAEFLVHEAFPWDLVERIGVKSATMKAQVEAAISGARHQPPVDIRLDWYY
jgi:ssDNA thymidine ADP-ribosyltransferase, DarT